MQLGQPLDCCSFALVPYAKTLLFMPASQNQVFQHVASCASHPLLLNGFGLHDDLPGFNTTDCNMKGHDH